MVNKDKEIVLGEGYFDDDYEPQKIELINDRNEKETLLLQATFHLDNVEYAILSGIDAEEGMIYTIQKDRKGEKFFNVVEDEEELKEVIELYEAMADNLI